MAIIEKPNTPVETKHRKVFDDMIDAVLRGEKLNFGKIMRKNGYADTYSDNPHLLFKTKSFQSLLEHVPYGALLAKTIEEGLSDEHKRNATKNRDMLFEMGGLKRPKIQGNKLAISINKFTVNND